MLRKAGAYKEREGSLEGRGEGQAGQGNFLFLLILVSSFVVIFSLDARVRDGRALGAKLSCCCRCGPKLLFLPLRHGSD